MVYRVLADVVMLVHFSFLVFLAVGGFLAWRYRSLIWPHLAAAGWGLMSVLVGVECPLTGWENGLRAMAGQQGLPPEGFIDTYLTGVVYPAEHLLTMQLLVAALVAVSWLGLVHRVRSVGATEPAPSRLKASRDVAALDEPER